jgi:hypothetical protein
MKQLLTKTEYKKFQKAEEVLAWLQWSIEKRLGGDLWNLCDEEHDWLNADVDKLVICLSNINIIIQENDIKDLVGKKLSKKHLEIINKG